MALTLTEGELYSTTDILSRTVIDRLVKDDPILMRLGFDTILGNSDTFVTVTTRSGAGVYEVGDTWTESTPSVGIDTVVLKILGGDADVDNFLLETRSNKLDLKGTVLNDKTLAVKELYLDLFYYGTAFDSTGFAGLHQKMTSTTYNTVNEGTTATESVLNISNLRSAIDLIRGFQPDIMVMSRLMRRSLATYFDSIGDKMPGVIDKFGKQVPSFDGIPIFPSDHITDTETIASSTFSARTGGTSTTIFILTFDSSAACGVQGSTGLKVVPLGELETKDASRYRIKWYCAMKMKNLRSCAKVDGVDPDGTVAA
uniref:Putative capsid protein n=1 Tax=viral metagenome TaxID=1070528 RepID=A0A6H1ZHS7_9ZZZZ